VGSTTRSEIVPRYRDEIPRVVKTADGERSAPISLRGFLDPSLYPEVSAVIFSARGVWSPPRRIGRDLITAYNTVACQPLPAGTIPLGREYWADTVLRHRDNRAPLLDPEPDGETKAVMDERLARPARCRGR
jgi:hypothetical protein